MNSARYNFAERSPQFISHATTLVGASLAMQKVSRLIERVGPTDATVLLTGESGSGKSATALAIHSHSDRRHGPFVSINCAAIPAHMIESELFGCENVPGDGAVTEHAGALERADGGTLLLDEVAEMPLDVQSRLLEVLESGKFYRVGGSTERSSDLRVLAATGRCPLTAAKSGLLRRGLLYRLAVVPINLPPLRSRGEDVEMLAEHFLAELNGRAGSKKRLSSTGRLTLKQHKWPGNVRELKNCVEMAFMMDDVNLDPAPLIQRSQSQSGHSVLQADAGRAVSKTDDRNASAADNNHDDIELGRLDIRVGSRIHDMERSLIEATLDHFKGNKRRAADTLGCSLKTLYNKLNGYSHSQDCADSLRA